MGPPLIVLTIPTSATTFHSGSRCGPFHDGDVLIHPRQHKADLPSWTKWSFEDIKSSPGHPHHPWWMFGNLVCWQCCSFSSIGPACMLILVLFILMGVVCLSACGFSAVAAFTAGGPSGWVPVAGRYFGSRQFFHIDQGGTQTLKCQAPLPSSLCATSGIDPCTMGVPSLRLVRSGLHHEAVSKAAAGFSRHKGGGTLALLKLIGLLA